MIYRSPFPDVTIPDVPFHTFVMEPFSTYGRHRALVDGFSGLTLTYDDLRRLVNNVAGNLVQRGLKRGEVVAVYAPNCPEFAVAVLGVLRAGGVVTPVNANYNPSELAHQLRDADARYVVTSGTREENVRAILGEVDVRTVYVIRDRTINEDDQPVEEFEPLMEIGATPPVLDDLNPAEDVALLPYSSGTTGEPKGIMLTHRNLVANLLQAGAVESLTTDDRVMGVLPFYHIFGLMSFIGLSMHAGATVVTMPRFDFEYFIDLIQRHEITVAFLVPPMVLGLAKHPAVGTYDTSSLRYITCGAAPLSADLATECAERLGCVVKQGYGMAETSPATHGLTLDMPPKPASVGRALPNTSFRLVDMQTRTDVETGAHGELWIRGPQVMKGYLHDLEATATVLDDDGWLHTGDVARADADEYLYIVDRVKELIMCEGKHVAPAELEALILAHPEVMDAAVVPVPDPDAGEVPKAFVVRAPGSGLTADALMAHVADQVPAYKRVRHVAFVGHIPKSPSGKTLRRKLLDDA